MRVINLDETGIKLINNKRNQLYLSKDDVKSLVNGQYFIKDSILHLNNYTLALSQEEINDFNMIINYLKSEILKQNL